MIDLSSSITFTPNNLIYLNSLQNPSKVQSESWDAYKNTNDMKYIKRAIKVQLLRLQNKRCAYCMKKFDVRSYFDGEREHFVDKATYPLFTFHEKNIVLACTTCNKGLKKRHDSIDTYSVDYDRCSFNIVHPIVDTVANHLYFTTDSMIKHITQKGSDTVTLFKLDSNHMTQERQKDIMLKKKKDNLNYKLKNMIKEAVRYVRKVT